MNERFDWSASLGRWLGIPVRVHLLLLLALIGIFAIDSQMSKTDLLGGTGLATALTLLTCLLVHELAHLVAVTHLGGEIHSFVLTPWGGASAYTQPANHRDRLVVHFAGPFINGCLFLLGFVMLLQAGFENLRDLVNPLTPQKFEADRWAMSLLAISTWTNFQLFLLNMVPCFPFDGGRFLRDMFASINRELSHLKIESTVLAIGQLCGIIFIVIAVLLRNVDDGPFQPTYAWMMAFGVSLIFCSRFDYRNQIREHLEMEDWDEEVDDEPLDRDLLFTDSELQFMADENYSQWLVEKQQQRELMRHEQQLEIESAEEQRADQILSKLHEFGIHSLTEDERLLLERVSARARRRRK